jgi:hypothetical protein
VRAPLDRRDRRIVVLRALQSPNATCSVVFRPTLRCQVQCSAARCTVVRCGAVLCRSCSSSRSGSENRTAVCLRGVVNECDDSGSGEDMTPTLK